MTRTFVARHSCIARNNDWRRHAQHLRDLAVRQHLSQDSRETLLREAAIADACGDEWLTGAIELPHHHGDQTHEPL